MVQRLSMAFALIVLAGVPDPAPAYVEAPMSLGAIIAQSSNIMVVRVEKVDKQNNVIVYRKVQDLKGKHAQETITHAIGKNGFHPREWQYPMEWAEVGKTAVFFHNGGASETCIGTYWYQAYGNGGNWGMSHGEPFLLRSYAGKPDKLAAAVTDILANKEVVVSCMVDGNKDDLQLRRARIQKLKASLKLQDYNPKRDFVGWGGVEDFRPLEGMPGFSRYSALPRVDPDAQAVSVLDIDGDGKLDFCLTGPSKTALIFNNGEALNENSLPGLSGGARAAVWADFNGDGKPDLFLATPTGPRLFTNAGSGAFRDDTALLPKESSYNLTAAAWLDYDGDGKPDLLLGNGFHGLRLYRNNTSTPDTKPPKPPVFGKWSYIGPFDNTGQKGFDTVYPPEKEIDLKKEYDGKGEKAVWKQADFPDGQVNNLALFKNNGDGVVYLYREIETEAAVDVPVSLGSDDTLTVWLNGEKILAENVYRAAAPDQNQAVLKLKTGKNTLLMKICQGFGEWSFYFARGTSGPVGPAIQGFFEDVSTNVGLGPEGLGNAVKGDALIVADVDGDGRTDVLYTAGAGLLLRNTPQGFVEVKESGLSFKAGKVGPIFGDFNGDGHLDLFVPQNGTCKLFHNDGKGRFVDVTSKAGDLALAVGQAVSAAAGDFDNDGHLDLLIGCLGSPNRYLHNRGDGTFVDATETLGLTQRIFNSQAVALADLNNDGVVDAIFVNEGQESAVLLGQALQPAKRLPMTVLGVGVGCRVRVLDKNQKLIAMQEISGGDGRGGQTPLLARFALPPGEYQVELRASTGKTRTQPAKIGDTAARVVFEK